MSSKTNRLISLDAFRGFTIAAMILVNSPGTYRAVYHQLRHAQWNGWTFADIVFPSFLFIMGVSLVYSFAARQSGNGNSRLEFQIAKRTVLLFALGLFLNSFPIFHFSTLRIPGVLQRIALCYFFTSLIVLKTGLRGRILWVVGLLAGYWLAMRFVPVPGVGTGVLEPGNNLAAYVDSLFLSGHMWTHYEIWDPEGLFSTLPAIATTLFGVLTGDWLQSTYTGRQKAAGMLCAGLVLVVLGMFLNQWFPINKSIWTSTFVVFMAGLALVALSFFYWSIELAGYRRWATPFVIFGMNSITIFVLSEVLDTLLRFIRLPQASTGSTISIRSWLFWTFFMPLTDPKTASLLFALGFVLFMLLIAWLMWRKRLFVKL